MNKLELLQKTTASSYKLYSILEMMSRSNGECAFSNEKLKELINIHSNATLIKAKNELRDLNLIIYQSQRCGNRNSITKYRILDRCDKVTTEHSVSQHTATDSSKFEDTTTECLIDSSVSKNTATEYSVSPHILTDSSKYEDTITEQNILINNTINSQCQFGKISESTVTNKKSNLYDECSLILDKMYHSKTVIDYKNIVNEYQSLDKSILSERQLTSLNNRYSAISKRKDIYFSKYSQNNVSSEQSLNDSNLSNEIKSFVDNVIVHMEDCLSDNNTNDFYEQVQLMTSYLSKSSEQKNAYRYIIDNKGRDFFKKILDVMAIQAQKSKINKDYD